MSDHIILDAIDSSIQGINETENALSTNLIMQVNHRI